MTPHIPLPCTIGKKKKRLKREVHCKSNKINYTTVVGYAKNITLLSFFFTQNVPSLLHSNTLQARLHVGEWKGVNDPASFPDQDGSGGQSRGTLRVRVRRPSRRRRERAESSACCSAHTTCSSPRERPESAGGFGEHGCSHPSAEGPSQVGPAGTTSTGAICVGAAL